MENDGENGDRDEQDQHGWKCLFEGVEVEYLDASDTNEPCEEVVEDPVFKQEGQSSDSSCDCDANEIAPTKEFIYSVFEWPDYEEDLVEAQEGKRNSDQDPQNSDENERVARLPKGKFQKQDDGYATGYAEDQEREPF